MQPRMRSEGFVPKHLKYAVILWTGACRMHRYFMARQLACAYGITIFCPFFSWLLAGELHALWVHNFQQAWRLMRCSYSGPSIIQTPLVTSLIPRPRPSCYARERSGNYWSFSCIWWRSINHIHMQSHVKVPRVIIKIIIVFVYTTLLTNWW